MDKTYIPNWLQTTVIYPFLKKWELLDDFEIRHFLRKERFHLETASLVFIVRGLLKQYHGYRQRMDGGHFIQFLQPEMFFIYEYHPCAPRLKILQSTDIVSLPLTLLEPCLLQDKIFRRELNDLLNLHYYSRPFLSDFLHELADPDMRFRMLLDIYGENLLYLSEREIALFSGISDYKIHSYIYHHFIKDRY